MGSIQLEPDPDDILSKELAKASPDHGRTKQVKPRSVRLDPNVGLNGEVKKYRKVTQDDTAHIIALRSEGNSLGYIANQVGLSPRTVGNHTRANADKIAVYREEKLRDRIEDYDRCIAKLFLELEDAIDAHDLQPKDIIKGLDVLVKKRLLIQGQPTAVHAIVNESAMEDLDELANDPAAYLENHAAVRKAAIKLLAQRDGEEVIDDYDVVDEGGDADGSSNS